MSPLSLVLGHLILATSIEGIIRGGHEHCFSYAIVNLDHILGKVFSKNMQSLTL